ncbi:MAG TPA: hypothetical protein VGP72_15490 [Planctomycetota bacterium]|jgi:hypothetical protein
MGLQAGTNPQSAIRNPQSSELCGRLIICLSLAALLFALWTPRLEQAAMWSAKELRVLPRLSIFVLCALVALILRGAEASARRLLLLGLASAGTALLVQAVFPCPETFAAVPKGPQILAGPVLSLLLFESCLLAAVLLGLWLGRNIEHCSGFIGLLLCAIAGDLWLNGWARVPESVPLDHPLHLLRLPWPPALGRLGLSPAFTDIVVLSAAMEASRKLRFHVLSIVLGGLAGYAAGSVLALEPWLAPWTAWGCLSMVLFTSGVLVGCWPELEWESVGIGKALLLASLLMFVLLGSTVLHSRLQPRPQPPVDMARFKNAT